MNEAVRPKLEKSFLEGVNLIKAYKSKYAEFGIFGSFSRGDYKLGSDVDFVIFSDDLITPESSYLLRSGLDAMGCDLVIMPVHVLVEQDSRFQKNLIRDYRRVDYGGEEYLSKHSAQ